MDTIRSKLVKKNIMIYTVKSFTKINKSSEWNFILMGGASSSGYKLSQSRGSCLLVFDDHWLTLGASPVVFNSTWNLVLEFSAFLISQHASSLCNSARVEGPMLGSFYINLFLL